MSSISFGNFSSHHLFKYLLSFFLFLPPFPFPPPSLTFPPSPFLFPLPSFHFPLLSPHFSLLDSNHAYLKPFYIILQSSDELRAKGLRIWAVVRFQRSACFPQPGHLLPELWVIPPCFTAWLPIFWFTKKFSCSTISLPCFGRSLTARPRCLQPLEGGNCPTLCEAWVLAVFCRFSCFPPTSSNKSPCAWSGFIVFVFVFVL